MQYRNAKNRREGWRCRWHPQSLAMGLLEHKKRAEALCPRLSAVLQLLSRRLNDHPATARRACSIFSRSGVRNAGPIDFVRPVMRAMPIIASRYLIATVVESTTGTPVSATCV